MATPKKKHLIELMIEAGVKWPEGAEYAAQDKKDNWVQFYKDGKPNYPIGFDVWMADNCTYMLNNDIPLPALCRNWHQTIVTREQYEKALADTSVTPTAQPAPKYCASVMRQMPNNTSEQLADDYRAKTAEADRLQAVADEALKAAKDALIALEKAGELLGLVISMDTKQKTVEQTVEPAQPEITNWRNLQIGDVIMCVTQGNYGYHLERLNWVVGEECQVVKLEEPGFAGQPILAKFKNGEEWWIGEFKFIRRP